MSSATAEKTKAEAPKTEESPPAAPWTMPKVRVGQQVMWHRHGEKLDDPRNPPEVAFVIKSGQRSISRLKTTDGFPVEGVPHIDDPRLKNANMRSMGAWDFIEEEKAQLALNGKLTADIAALVARVSALEEQLKKK
jgi:hypothetical protein